MRALHSRSNRRLATAAAVLLGTSVLVVGLGATPATADRWSVSPDPAGFGQTVVARVDADFECELVAPSGQYTVIWRDSNGDQQAANEVILTGSTVNTSNSFTIPTAGPEGTWTVLHRGLRQVCPPFPDMTPVTNGEPVPFEVVAELEPIAADGLGGIVLGSLAAAGAAVAFLAHRRRNEVLA